MLIVYSVYSVKNRRRIHASSWLPESPAIASLTHLLGEPILLCAATARCSPDSRCSPSTRAPSQPFPPSCPSRPSRSSCPIPSTLSQYSSLLGLLERGHKARPLLLSDEASKHDRLALEQGNSAFEDPLLDRRPVRDFLPRGPELVRGMRYVELQSLQVQILQEVDAVVWLTVPVADAERARCRGFLVDDVGDVTVQCELHFPEPLELLFALQRDLCEEVAEAVGANEAELIACEEDISSLLVDLLVQVEDRVLGTPGYTIKRTRSTSTPLVGLDLGSHGELVDEVARLGGKVEEAEAQTIIAPPVSLVSSAMQEQFHRILVNREVWVHRVRKSLEEL
ncbi:hypothetical protein BJ546DRAFT_28810 [Cryomyces antarcticus]